MWFAGGGFPYANHVGLWPVPRCPFEHSRNRTLKGEDVKGPADTRHPSSTRAYNDPRVKQTPARCIEKGFDAEEQTRRVPSTVAAIAMSIACKTAGKQQLSVLPESSGGLPSHWNLGLRAEVVETSLG